MIRTFLSAGVAITALAMTASAQSVAVTNAKLWTGDALIDNATVVIRDGRVTASGADVTVPSGVSSVDADGAWVTPGIFAAFSRVGIVEVGAEDPTNDSSASASNFGAALLVADAFNPAAVTIAATRLEGVTRIGVAPGFGSGIIGGQGFVADTSGTADSVTEPQAFTFINMGEGGAGLSGGSRASAWAYFRAALSDARTYPARYITHDIGDVLPRVDAQAFGPASRGQQLMLFSVNRASDIRTIIDLKNEREDFKVAIVGGAEAWMVADELAEAEIGVVIDPFANLPGSFEALGATQHNAERLIDAGVTVAFSYFDDSSHQSRLVLQSAGNAVANGVAHEDALRAITSAPAEIFEIDGAGSLEAGGLGDLVIWDGDPLEVMSAPTAVYIGGVEQSLESRQTRLRDRYLSLDESEKPLAFKH